MNHESTSVDASVDEFDPFAGPAIAVSIPSTAQQREVWSAAQMGLDAALAFNEVTGLRLSGALDRSALLAALTHVVARHEALRAEFSRDGLTMLVHEPTPVDVRIVDLTVLDDASARDAALRHEHDVAARTAFDLERGPLVQFVLIRITSDEHELVTIAHHIICDGWSLGVIVTELAELYTARVTGRATTLSDPARYSDYAISEGAALRSPERAADLTYWLQQYTGTIPVLDLPGDRPRPPRKTYVASREDRLIGQDLLRRVRATGASHGCSLFATLLTAFATMLHRLTGDDDLVIGVPSAGQSAAGQSGLVGHCVNMLPVRLSVPSSEAFVDLLPRVRSAALLAFEHQGVGFGTLLESLPVVRDPSRIPLIAATFNVDRTLPAASLAFGELQATLATVARVSENFDLSVNALESGDGLLLECQYNRDLFDAATIQRWLEAFEHLLGGVVADPTSAIAELPIVTDADRAALAVCNDSVRALPSELLVHATVESQVRRTPNAPAVVCGDATLTYAELNCRANQLARELRMHGVRRDTLVAVLLDRSEAMVVAVLAVLKAGAGYVYLDPNYPVDRLQFMASDTAAPVLVTDNRLAAALGVTAPVVLRLDGDEDRIAAHASDDLGPDAYSARPEDTAYVVYTSGSTGQPKGCLLPHRSLLNLMVSGMHEPGLAATGTMLSVTTVSFDIGSLELFLPLAVGARCVIAPRNDVVDAERLKVLIASSDATLMFGTPSLWRMLLINGWEGKSDLRVMCGGEALALDLARELAPRVAHLWNIYGPTETTIFSTLWRVPTPVESVMIGHLAANTVVAVLDQRGNQTPIGVTGELFIGGRGVTTGYVNRPELTAARFVTPLGASHGRYYRTGDLVRLRASGELEYVGRNDDQVKIRGFRVEPGEVEEVLRRAPAVRSVAVVAREDRANDLRLVAYVVTMDGALDADALRDFVRQSVPAFMVPSAFVQLPALPMTPSGKVDRRALPVPESLLAGASQEGAVLPETPSEALLAALWAEVLGRPSVGVTDDFFVLGGHSLLASQLLSRLRRDHGIQLSFRDIFDTPTIRGLAAIVDRSSGAPGHAQAGLPQPQATIPTRAGAQHAPLSVLQERICLLEELEPGQRAAHAHSAAWRLFGDLDAARLERAIRAFIARHPAMRTCVETVDGQRRQVVASEVAFDLHSLDLSTLDASEQDERLAAFFREQQFSTFDMSVAPLFRAALIRFGATHHMLYTLQHGLIWDGWTFDLFLGEVTEHYAADEASRAPVLNPLPVTYGDFAAWQAEWLSGPEATAQSTWWKRQLAGALDELQLPEDYPKPAVSANRGHQISVPFTTDEAEQLRLLARRYDATLFMVVFAAYNVVLQRFTGQNDLLVASPVRARTRPELEAVVGPFVNTLLLRNHVTPEMTFPALLRAVRDVTLDSFSNQELPFERLDLRVPPVRALFSMQDARTRPVSMGSLAVDQYHVPQYFTTNDLMLWMMESRTTLHAVLKYNAELFTQSTAEMFLAELRAFLMALLADADAPVGRIGRESPSEGRSARRLAADLGDAPSLRALVFTQSTGRLDQVALRCETGALTYADLDSRVARIATGLDARGLNRGSTVAVALKPGLDRVIAVLGVLAAGLDVLLLDPNDPIQYVSTLATAASAALIVASGTAFDGAEVNVVDLHAIDALADGRDMRTHGPMGGVRIATLCAAERVEVASVSGSTLAAQVRELAAITAAATGSDVVLGTLHAQSAAAVLEMLWPLAAGLSSVDVPSGVRDDGDDLRDLLEETGATAMCSSPEQWSSLLATKWRPADGFRAIVVTGRVLTADDVRAMRGRVERSYALFVRADCPAAVSLEQIAPDDGMSYLSASGVAGASFSVVDATGAMVSPGMRGALHVEFPGGELRTTVVARDVGAGRVQLRSDHADSLRLDAPAVHLEVVAEELRAFMGMLDAAVSHHRDDAGVLRVVAYVVRAPGTASTDTALRAFVRQRLPRSCVPNRIVEVESIPRDSTGAPQFAILASVFAGSALHKSHAVAPRTEIESLLVTIWAEILGVSQVGVLDNFFSLGGTSLLAFRVVEQVRLRTGRHLNPRLLLVGTLEQAAQSLSVPSQESVAEPAMAPKGVLARLKGLLS